MVGASGIGITCVGCVQHTARGSGEPVWSNDASDKVATAVAPQQSNMYRAGYPRAPEIQNYSITIQGARATSRYTDLLKVSDMRSCVQDAVKMQNVCLALSRKGAADRVQLRKEIRQAVQDMDGLVLFGL